MGIGHLKIIREWNSESACHFVERQQLAVIRLVFLSHLTYCDFVAPCHQSFKVKVTCSLVPPSCIGPTVHDGTLPYCIHT